MIYSSHHSAMNTALHFRLCARSSLLFDPKSGERGVGLMHFPTKHASSFMFISLFESNLKSPSATVRQSNLPPTLNIYSFRFRYVWLLSDFRLPARRRRASHKYANGAAVPEMRTTSVNGGDDDDDVDEAYVHRTTAATTTCLGSKR